MTVSRVEFRFGEALPAKDPVARWITVLAMALNDLILVNRLAVEEDLKGGESVYFLRLASAHLIELAEPKGLLTAGIDDWPEVQDFVARLPAEAHQKLAALRSLTETSDGSLGERIRAIRNRLFHYPHLHGKAARRGKLEIQDALNKKREQDGSLTVDGGVVGGIRCGFADEVALTALDLSEDDFEELVIGVRDTQIAFLQFAEVALHEYFEKNHRPSLRVADKPGGGG